MLNILLLKTGVTTSHSELPVISFSIYIKDCNK